MGTCPLRSRLCRECTVQMDPKSNWYAFLKIIVFLGVYIYMTFQIRILGESFFTYSALVLFYPSVHHYMTHKITFF